MTFGLLNFAMLAGLAGVAIPVLIHFLSRRRDPVVDWGAMQFLMLKPKERRRLNLADLLLLFSRMLLLALVALALARPYWKPPASASATVGGGGRRDVVLIVDGSSSMARKSGGTSAADKAVAWARDFVKRLKPGDSAAVLIARDRVKPLVDPPSFDFAKIDDALAKGVPPRGAGDLATSIGEAFRVLERTHNPNREVIIVTDDQRSGWRPGETERWSLLRELRRRMAVPPRLWAVSFGSEETAVKGANGSVGTPALPRGAIVPGRTLNIVADVANAGPEPLTRSVELLVDGRPEPGAKQVVGPIAVGGRAPVSFSVALETPGDHLLTIQLGPGDDPIPGDDRADLAVGVIEAMPVLLVDGEPSPDPLGGEVAYLRAALAPNGDDARRVVARTIDARRFVPDDLKDRRVAVLANVDRLSVETLAALESFVAAGGGLFVAPGDRTDAAWWNENAARLLPAKIGPIKGDPAAKTPVARPAPASFTGAMLGPLGSAESATLREAGFFAYHVLTPATGASAIARFDTGDPWLVERPIGKGKVLLAAAPFDAEAGTLPVNPDFVPLVHELMTGLGEGGTPSRNFAAGEPIVFAIPPSSADAATLKLHPPDGEAVDLPVTNNGGTAVARRLETTDPGVYRLELDGRGRSLYAVVASDPRESAPEPLAKAEANALAEGWPLTFAPEGPGAIDLVLSNGTNRRNEVWRILIYVAMISLCGEVWLTRRTAKARGLG